MIVRQPSPIKTVDDLKKFQLIVSSRRTLRRRRSIRAFSIICSAPGSKSLRVTRARMKHSLLWSGGKWRATFGRIIRGFARADRALDPGRQSQGYDATRPHQRFGLS